MISLLFVAALNLICAAYNRLNHNNDQTIFYLLMSIIAMQILMMFKIFKG